MRTVLYTLFLLLCSLPAQSQHTFSIVAVDSITGEVGSAGASCLDDITFPGSGGAIIISDLLPGKGAIHTQAYYHATNQANARLKMEEGLSPAEILPWLKQHDPEGIFGALKRQYGIVDFDSLGHPRSAAFTGNSCNDWKGHRTGITYSIQGNILLGPQILDSMEAHFLSNSGTLADRLMYALQGANVVGADTRCTDNGTSSLSAFLRVAKPDDADSLLYLDLNVPSLPAGMEPIDSLQNIYNTWKLTGVKQPSTLSASIFPNPASQHIVVTLDHGAGMLNIFALTGQKMGEYQLQAGQNILYPKLPTGVYFTQIKVPGQTLLTSKLFWQRTQ